MPAGAVSWLKLDIMCFSFPFRAIWGETPRRRFIGGGQQKLYSFLVSYCRCCSLCARSAFGCLFGTAIAPKTQFCSLIPFSLLRCRFCNRCSVTKATHTAKRLKTTAF